MRSQMRSPACLSTSMNVTGFLFANNFAADLGIGTTPAVSSITNVTITVTSPDIFSSQGTYNESAATFQILAPEGRTPAECFFPESPIFPACSYGVIGRKIEAWPLLFLPMSRRRSASWRPSYPMRGPCAAAPCRNALSNAASQVALARTIQRLAMVLTTASRMPSAARPTRASSLRSRLIWSGNRLMPAVGFAAVWMRCGRHLNNGRTIS